MTINHYLSTFAGLPVTAWHDEATADPAGVAWRLEVEFEEDGDFAPAFERLLEFCGPAGPTALVIGEWGSAYDQRFPFDLLISNAGRLSGLRSLFIGEMTVEQCEISWIIQGDYAPLLAAFPQLERLWIRGAQNLAVGPVSHGALRELVIQSGGLPASVLRGLLDSDLPHLDRLELWLGVANYGGDITVDDLAPILSGRAFPALTHLGLCNAEIAEQIAAAVAAAPVVARLTGLDLSKGVLGDEGAAALLAGQPLTHLESLDLSHHFMTKEMAQRVVDELPGVAVDVSDPQDETRWGRYTVVAE
ncbi:STM4015 family protein [Actinoplanes sp. G11-F43]|uniref:STM4015 family protein n=1 Tax=Actinoplanes sp. G11-F43 TaxID=3424130 RepID=UPI003D34D07E